MPFSVANQDSVIKQQLSDQASRLIAIERVRNTPDLLSRPSNVRNSQKMATLYHREETTIQEPASPLMIATPTGSRPPRATSRNNTNAAVVKTTTAQKNLVLDNQPMHFKRDAVTRSSRESGEKKSGKKKTKLLHSLP